jgi:hypothetical protein
MTISVIGGWKIVLGARSIQVTKVLADPHLAIFLLHGDDVGEPLSVLGLLDETCSD